MAEARLHGSSIRRVLETLWKRRNLRFCKYRRICCAFELLKKLRDRHERSRSAIQWNGGTKDFDNRLEWSGGAKILDNL